MDTIKHIRQYLETINPDEIRERAQQIDLDLEIAWDTMLDKLADVYYNRGYVLRLVKDDEGYSSPRGRHSPVRSYPRHSSPTTGGSPAYRYGAPASPRNSARRSPSPASPRGSAYSPAYRSPSPASPRGSAYSPPSPTVGDSGSSFYTGYGVNDLPYRPGYVKYQNKSGAGYRRDDAADYVSGVGAPASPRSYDSSSLFYYGKTIEDLPHRTGYIRYQTPKGAGYKPSTSEEDYSPQSPRYRRVASPRRSPSGGDSGVQLVSSPSSKRNSPSIDSIY